LLLSAEGVFELLHHQFTNFLFHLTLSCSRAARVPDDRGPPN
jgi:hypothetical protein